MRNMVSENKKGPLYLFFAFALAGTSVIAARYVSGQLGTFTITSVSLLFALLFLLPFYGSELKKNLPYMAAKDWLMLFFQALFGMFLFRMFLLQGLLYTSAGEAGIFTGAAPAVTTLLARVILHEPFDRNSLAGLLSTVGGILLLQGLLLPGNSFSVEHFWGNMLVLCAAFSESIFNILSRINSLKNTAHPSASTNPALQTMLVSAIAFILCLIPALFEAPLSSLKSLGVKEWLALVWYGVFITALSYIYWYKGIQLCSARTAAAFSGMVPFTSLILSVMILGEKATFVQWVGGLLVILGMYLLGSQEERTLQLREG